MDEQSAAALANDWLKEFCLALRTVGLYSAVHPRARASVDRAFERLQSLLALRGDVVLTRSEGRVFVGESILDRDRLLSRQIAELMSARAIDGISIQPAITPQDHLGLLRCLLLAPDKIQAAGGFERVLEAEGVRSVQAERQRIVHAGGDAESSRYAALVELLARFRGTPASSSAGSDTTPIATAVVTSDPEDLGRALEAAAREARQAGSPSAIAAFVATTLETLAVEAIAERVHSRDKILGSVGDAVVGCAPATQVPLFFEHGGPRSPHRHVAEAIDALAPASIGGLVALHYPRALEDYGPLSRMLQHTSAWRARRGEALAAAEHELARLGVGQEEYKELVARLLWTELDDDRRVSLLQKNDYIWRADSDLVEIALGSLLKAGKSEEANHLVNRLVEGLSSPDAAVRRKVAEDVPAVVRAVEGAGGGRGALAGLAGSLIAQLATERDDAVAERIVTGLASLFAARARASELGLAIQLLRESDRLCAAKDGFVAGRGCLLAAELAGSVDAETAASLVRAALHEGPGAPEAVEILSRTSVPRVLQELAEEENRSRRAKLIALLKAIATRGWRQLVASIDDPRWYVVRNVVSILGEVSDAEVFPEILRAASHPDARVRREAVRALARFNAPESERKLVSALADADDKVRIAAVHALSAFPGSGAAGALMKVCEKAPPYQAVTGDVRLEAIQGLARSGSADAFAVLAKLLGKKGVLGRGEPLEVRVAAAKALGSVGTPAAVALLEELARKDSRERVREAAALALHRRES